MKERGLTEIETRIRTYEPSSHSLPNEKFISKNGLQRAYLLAHHRLQKGDKLFPDGISYWLSIRYDDGHVNIHKGINIMYYPAGYSHNRLNTNRFEISVGGARNHGIGGDLFFAFKGFKFKVEE